MRAVIFAAGLGSRLEGQAGSIPKVLLLVGGRTLLARHLHILSALGINDVSLGVGYEAGRVEEELARLGRQDVELVFNPDYSDGSIVTLTALGDALTRGGDVLVMDGDVLYDRRILGRLLETPHANCFLLDRDVEAGEEPMKLAIRGDAPVDFRKSLTEPHDYYGESVGFFRFSAPVARRLVKAANKIIAAGGRADYMEEAIRAELLASPGDFAFEDVTGLPWIEIDFPGDIVRAETEILPALLPEDT